MSKISFKQIIAISLTTAAISSTANAAKLSTWDNNGWTDITSPPSVLDAGNTNPEDWVGNNGYVDPGYGGQAFDAEYLLYKVENNRLHIGLQTGFDLQDGHVEYNSGHYWAGDIALSFDGVTLNNSGTGYKKRTFEYAVDLGFGTQCSYESLYNGGTCKSDDQDFSGDNAGLYKDVTWNNGGEIGFNSSNPFAMKSGTEVAGLLDVQVGSADEGDGLSYYRTFSIDLAVLNAEGITDLTNVDVHWTMTCGNDAVDGHFDYRPTSPGSTVPEPSSLVLFSLGLLGILRLRAKQQAV